MTDYQKMNATELQSLIENAEKALHTLKINKRKEVIAQIKELAASIDVAVDIIEVDKKSVPTRKISTPVPVKYRHPDNAEKTWTGRGVMPIWLKTLVEAGHDRSEFEI